MDIGNNKTFPLPKELNDILKDLWGKLGRIIK